MNGFVSLVGGGPGDPGLLTRKAVDRLRRADLVLYDALVSPETLAIARRAQRFYVGKRAGRHSIRQGAINQLMIRAARRGKRVVRLKCGDPYVLGRGGEEALALSAAGIRFEVIPGVTTAVAAPALAGIPVTHRGVSTGFAVISGHAEEAYAPMVDALPPNSITLVILMGVATRGAIAQRLIDRGWSGATPVALVSAASSVNQIVWKGSIAALGGAAIDARDAATIVIGNVVRLSDSIGRAEALPRTEDLPDTINAGQPFRAARQG
jgi:uroporphyrin-III C-methyltransferase/precorrin-2 dehydrogenase/sirohydrochlorin ferrochelatase